MKLFCTYILLIALTLQSFNRSIMFMEYQIHLPNYLSQCINKDKPQLQCNGKCVLMQKIKEKEQKETKKNLVAYEYSPLYLHNEYIVFTMDKPNEVIQEEHFLHYLINYTFKYNNSIFRPPGRVS